MTRPAQILILSDDAGRVRQWTEILADGARVWQAAADSPPDLVPEVIVTDRAVPAAEILHREASLRRWQAAEIGVVAIGEGPAAEVRLPADFTPRELRLVCQLLAETVRWRRECHRARQLQQTFSELASTDALTGLPNRRAWEDVIRQRASQLDSANGPLCLALFDVDHFKLINDRFGHIAGDEILCYVGRGLARARQDSDYVARLGGDEFAMLLAGRNPSAAADDVEAVRVAACQGAPHTQVTACMGFACAQNIPQDGLKGLFESADIALRIAKLSGRNRSVSAAG
jgi:diguanylate cyclase (GGDEF)-like protein